MVGWSIGYLNIPDGWYAQLAKPSFNPPNWVFGPVWTVLYVLISVAGWRTWTRDKQGVAMKLWWTQMLLNFVWSPTFFTLHQLWLSFAVIVVLLASILAFIAVQWTRDRTSAVLFLPYAAWVGFASVLNLSIAWLN